jgi:hypothetical protein
VNKLKKFSFVLLVLSVLLVPPLAAAARLDHLYEAEVPAAARDTAARDAALGVALQEVLERLTGSRAAVQSAAGARLLEAPGRFVEQYRFNEMPASDDQSRQLMLWAQFDGVSLSRELRQAGLPYWGAERPDVLVWLAVDDRGQRYLLSETGGQGAADMLRQSAQRSGLPVTLPLLDLEDQQAVQFTDVWGGFFGRIEAASQRYQPQVILTGKLERTSTQGGWRAEWQMADQGNRRSWTSRADSLGSVIDAGVSDTAEWLAQRYAVMATQAGMRALVVDAVHNLDDYARVSKYLASLSPVDRIDVVSVRDDQVEFNLKLSADERNLLQLITLGRMLQRTDDPAAWRFHLNP